MQQILSLNAFDMKDATRDGSAATAAIRDRARLFGAASVLFYDRPLTFVRGEGCWLFDADGTAFLDAYNNVPSVGHCHPHVVAAAARQLGQLNCHSRYLHDGVTAYAERLLATLPPSLSNVTFTCTGSEANDLALRLARQASGGLGIIVTESAYHGNTALVTEVSPSSLKTGRVPDQVRTVPAPSSRGADPADLAGRFARQVGDAILDLQRQGIKLAALLVDSIFSSDGVFADPPGFLAEAVERVHRAGGLLIADEVQPGFGRTGAGMWGFQRHGVAPDIVTMGKPMGNGYPIGAVVTRPAILAEFCANVGYFNTFGGTPVAAAIGQAVLDVIEGEALIAQAKTVGTHLLQGLTHLASRHAALGEVRGAGLYLGVDVRQDGAPSGALARRIINRLRDRQLLIGAAGGDGSVLKIRPPLCFSLANADRLLETLDATLSDPG